AFFFKAVANSVYFRGMMTGLKPFIVGITLYAAISMALKNGMLGVDPARTIPSLAIAVISFILLLKTKLHPIILIAGGAAAGLLLF
ncbi:MAG: chromate transporter, partial [Spirochaetaceae bacterium]|nr:chromate transporter [Spirochaetaceae bacterium]